MNINYRSNFAIEFEMFKDFPIEKCKAAKQVNVYVTQPSKTRVSISLMFDMANKWVDIIPEASKKFKFDQEVRKPYFYFKITKKQGLKEFEEHLKNVVAEVLQIDTSADFTLNVKVTRAILAMGVPKTEFAAHEME